MPGMSGGGRIGFTVHNVLTLWQFSAFPIAVAVVLLALAAWYLRADWRLAARGRRWSGWRTLAFMSGLVTIDLALQSPVVAFTGGYFEAHVIQHLLLMVIAPPLLALGAPSTLLLQTSSRTTKTRWLSVLRSSPFAALSHPITVWGLYYGVMFAFFLTPILNYAMLHMWLMDCLNVMFLMGATLFWWPMVGIDPIIHWKLSFPARMANILLGSGVEAFLGVAILNSHHTLASMYTLSSSRAGGGLLWAATEVVTLGAFVPIYFQWMRSEDRIAVRSDNRAGGAISITIGPRRLGTADDEPVAAAAGGAPRPATAPASAALAAARARAGPVAPTFRVPTQGLTAWEYAWMTRTGTVPSRFVAPDHAPEDGDP